jgi:hypothetical protein
VFVRYGLANALSAGVITRQQPRKESNRLAGFCGVSSGLRSGPYDDRDRIRDGQYRLLRRSIRRWIPPAS